MHTIAEIAEALGLRTANGRPHVQLVCSLLKGIEAVPAYYESNSIPIYGHCVLPLLRQKYGRAVRYELPEQVKVCGRQFNVRYWPEEEPIFTVS
ncbi:hypothetical protein [Aneurinibacillus aneurinilyticus]|uniref:hypothetical protein n=1 Tax=Aneurinibacillus aneurinilyticus TaxID=1391 RepID=UPI0035246E53